MLTKTEKSRRSTILDEIRENSLDEKWLDEQLDFFETSLKTDPEIVILSNWICIGDPFMDINGTIMKKIDSKQFTSIDFIQKKLSEFYSDFLDENKLNKETESILGFSSEIDKENTKGYNFSTDYLKTLVKNLSNKKNLSKNQIESCLYHFAKEMRIKRDSISEQFDFSKFLIKSQFDKLVHLQHKRWYACPEFFIRVYYDLEENKIVFRHKKNGNQIYLGRLRISITLYGNKSTLFNAVLSNDKERLRIRFKKEIAKLIKQFYLKSYKKETSITDVLSGDAFSEFLSSDVFNTYVENSMKSLKEFFTSCTHKDKEKILEMIKEELKL